jgi:hypothetical protein
MVLFRRLLGDVLRRHRLAQGRTLRDVAATARVSLGYLSEVERGLKEASSELLCALCAALGISLADVLREVSDDIAMLEGHPLPQRGLIPVGFGKASPAPVAPARTAMAPVASARTAMAPVASAPAVSGPTASVPAATACARAFVVAA